MRRVYVISFLSLLLLLSFLLSPLQVMATADRLPSGIEKDALSDSIEQFVATRKDQMAGMAYMVFDERGVFAEGAYGDKNKDAGLKVEIDTVFEWGSITKLLTWVSVMQLKEQGKIDLEAPVKSYLPQGFLSELPYDDFTMLDMMNHRTGVQDGATDLFLKEEEPVQELSDALLTYLPHQAYKPGAITAYSNWSTALAGFVVEEISGLPFYDYVREHIFLPLGMNHTSLQALQEDNPEVKEDRRTTRGYMGQRDVGAGMYHIPLYPAGGAVGTVGDLATFGAALFSGDLLFADAATLTELFQATDTFYGTDDAKNSHGFWITYYQVPAYGHLGGTAICNSALFIDPEEKIGMAVMTNQMAESSFTGEMPQLIFGDLMSDPSIKESGRVVDAPFTLYHEVRRSEVGPFKLMNTIMGTHNPPKESDEVYWSYDNGSESGFARAEFRYSDRLPRGVFSFISTHGLIVLWGIGTLYAFGIIIGGIVRGIIRRRKRAKGEAVQKSSLEKWRYVFAFALLALPALFIFIVMLLMGMTPARAISPLFIGFIVLLLFYVFYLIILARKKGEMRVLKQSKRVYFDAFFALISILMIVVFNLYQFWNV